MTNLCITLRSVYSSEDDPNGDLNNEVAIDAETVRETLNDHDHVEIIIPTRADRLQIDQTIKDAFATILQAYQHCHIVLNTHGVAGRSDLKSGAVQEVVLHLSHRNILVTQISALQCNGMLNQLSIAQERGYVDIFRPRRPSCLKLLQSKLERTQTPIQQSFCIYGFLLAYNPILDKPQVIALLQGRGKSLEVATNFQLPMTNTDYLKEIAKSIHEIRHTKREWTHVPNAYSIAANLLGNVLQEMKKNIIAYLEGDAILAPENKALYDSLYRFAEESIPALKWDAQELDNIWSQWIKVHKISSKERLDVLESYHRVLSKHDELLEETIERHERSSVAESILPYTRYRFIKSETKPYLVRQSKKQQDLEVIPSETDVTDDEGSHYLRSKT